MYVIWGHKEVISGRPFWWNSQRGGRNRLMRNDILEYRRERGRARYVSILWAAYDWLSNFVLLFSDNTMTDDVWRGNWKEIIPFRRRERLTSRSHRPRSHQIPTIYNQSFFPLKYISCIAWAPLKIHNLSNAAGQQRAFGKTPYRIGAALVCDKRKHTAFVITKI